MRAEIFFKNGKKATVDNVINIEKRNGDVVIDFKRNISGGEFTTCDMPSMGFEEAKIDMIKLVGFE